MEAVAVIEDLQGQLAGLQARNTDDAYDADDAPDADDADNADVVVDQDRL